MKQQLNELFRSQLKMDLEIQSISRLGGLTNLNYKVETNKMDFVVRYPGNGTEELISRKDEYEFTKIANKLNIDAKNYYFDPKTGVKISRYIPGAITFNPKLIQEKSNLELVAEILQRLHSSNQVTNSIFNVFDKIKEYEKLINESGKQNFWEDYALVRNNIYNLKKEYESFNVKLAFCHNDPLCENFVLGQERLYLVDWEYAGMNDPLWDVADVIIEANLEGEKESLFKSLYFGREANEEEEMRIIMNKIFLDFLWSLWGKQRHSVGEKDMQSYADERYMRVKRNLTLLNHTHKEQ